MALSTAKGISIFFDEVCETWDANNIMSRQADVINFPSALQQNSNNTIWRQVEQETPVKNGWDMTGEFGEVLELSYPSTLGNPTNDAFQLRADDFRDDRFMMRRARQAVNKLSAEQNKRIAQLVVDTGSLAYKSANANYQHLATAETIMDSLELSGMGDRSFFLKPVNHEAIATDLAGRGTLSGRPEGAYGKSMIGRDIAGFDAFRANFIPTLAGNATAGVTVSGAQSFIPEGSTTNSDGTEVPVDYREALVTVSATAGLVRGDKITFTGVNEVSAANKLDTGRERTFSIVEVVDGTTIKVFPKPIAWDQRPIAEGGDGTLTAEQAAYANVTTSLADTTPVVLVNDGAGTYQPDVFWTNDSVEIVAGDAPFELMGELDGFKVMKETLDSGTTLYMMWQGSIGTATLQARVFAWYGLVNKKPTHNGIALPTF